jgi:hypothetical protein
LADQFAQAAVLDASRLRPLIAEPTNDNLAADNKRPTSEVDEEQFLDVGKLRSMYIDYLTNKTDEIWEQKESRRYYHGAQLTGDQIRTLVRRGQPPQKWNRINRKINGIVGVVERLRSDPKAMPNNQRSEQGADIATSVVRYVLSRNDAKGIEPWILLQAGIDGIGGTQLVMTTDEKGQPDIEENWVIGDEFFYDPTSYRLDFDDATFKGISKWVHMDVALGMFPGKEDLIKTLGQSDSDLTSNADRDYKWFITESQRLRLVEHWYLHQGRWCWAFYSNNVIIDEGESPYFNERGKSVDSFRMFSVAVDQDGDRYGFVRNIRDPQDALNQSKSKALHIANSRRIIAEKGAVDSVENARTQAARPDGLIEVNPGFEFRFDDKPQDVAAFAAMAEAAAQEIDSFANINMAALSGASLANISGRAIELLRQPGLAELGPFILAIRQWKLQRFRLIWTTAQRHWTTEKWISLVDDDSQKPVFLQLNGKMLDQFGMPVTVNALGALDVNITMEEGPDVATVMQETNELLRTLPPGSVPPALFIETSKLPRSQKNKLLQMLKPQPNPIQLAAAKAQLEGALTKNAKTAADARRSDALAVKALADSHQGQTQSQIDAAELLHRMWAEALQMFTPQMQPGQAGPGGQPGAPQPQPGPTPVPHPVMPGLPA